MTSYTTPQAGARFRDPPRREPTLADLFRSLRDDILLLFRQEVALAKAEVKSSLKAVALAAALVSAAAVTLLVALVFLLIAISAAVTQLYLLAGLEPVWAAWLGPLTTAVVLMLIGGVLSLVAYKRLKSQGLLPRRTGRTVKADARWVKRRAKGQRGEPVASRGTERELATAGGA